MFSMVQARILWAGPQRARALTSPKRLAKLPSGALQRGAAWALARARWALRASAWVKPVFEPYKDSKVDILAPKLLFIALNLAALALGVWKLNTLGLLPSHASDWVSSLPPAPEVEYSGGGLPIH
ncbi:hypothetical protein C4D60_Mb07t23270 [Musa balbisiana]|uniref:ER membrane protein complex subunit 4 n=1 Tax=Musa balbisiana TaxID=52838 RepID=A0A4S8JHE9_MUSBA|nr:hypothetical protein C4D60_Mb07t23270 [Musa balbisiana]